MPVILATQETDQEDCDLKPAKAIVHGTLSSKTLHKNRAGGVAQGEGLEFKPQDCKKIKVCRRGGKGT
jgi:hypothetical protein